MTARASGSRTPLIVGRPGLMMPAFSKAIFASVSPRICVWSKLMLVMIDSIGSQTLVESKRPPRPTSTMAKSTRRRTKCRKPRAVPISKKVSSRSSGGRGRRRESRPAAPPTRRRPIGC